MFTLDFLGLFVCITGYILGLGAVNVIDIHGFLGRKSAYWTEATIRTHKVTKPLIWIGIFLVLIGESIVYRNESYFSGIPLYHASIALVLIVNGLFLSFYVSPFLLKRERENKQRELLPAALQKQLIVSLVFSEIGWWGSLVLFVSYISQRL